ncbi:MAG TPA: hypothetical protein VGE98_14235 [Thermoanaerobaculia bacterium]
MEKTEPEARAFRPACVTVESRLQMATETEIDLAIPADLPFLASLSWFDRDFRNLAPIDMLSRYEAGWRHRGVLAEPSEEELRFIRALVHRFGSILDV